MVRRLSAAFAPLCLAAALALAPAPVSAQSTPTEIDWCNWKTAPIWELQAAYVRMSADLDAFERGLGVMNFAKAMLDDATALARSYNEPLPPDIQRAYDQYALVTRLHAHRKRVLECIRLRLQEAGFLRPPRGVGGRFGPRLMALKDRTDGLIRRADGLGPALDTIVVSTAADGSIVVSDGDKRRRLVPTADGKGFRNEPATGVGGAAGPGGGLELELGAAYRFRFAPRFEVGVANAGGGPIHRFSTDLGGVVPSLTLRWRLDRDWSLGIRVEGGTAGATRRSDSLGPGRITSLDGLNTQNIVAARDARLGLDCAGVGVDAAIERRWALDNPTTWLHLGLGFRYGHERCRYDFSQSVSGGGAFFLHAVDSRVRHDFFGALLAARLTRELGDGWRLAGHVLVVPGYYRGSLKGTQAPGTFGPTALTVEDRRGFAGVEIGGGGTLSWRRGAFEIGLRGRASHETGVPTLASLPHLGNLFRLNSGRRTKAEVMILLSVNIAE